MPIAPPVSEIRRPPHPGAPGHPRHPGTLGTRAPGHLGHPVTRSVLLTSSLTDKILGVVFEVAQRNIPCRLPRSTTLTEEVLARRRARRPKLRTSAVAAMSVVSVLLLATPAAGQDANVSTSVTPLGSGSTASVLTLQTITPKSATDRGPALPSLTLIDDGAALRVSNLTLELPDLGLGGMAVASKLGDQPLPGVFRGAPLAGSALAAPIRGVTFTTTGSAPLSVAVGQMGTAPQGAPGLAAAAVNFTPSTRVSVTPQALLPVDSPGGQGRVGTAIHANVAGGLALATDVGMAGTSETAWAPLASARLVGQWPRAGIETSVQRAAAAPRTDTDTALAASRDREAARAQVQPLPGLTLVALTSASRPSADPIADDTILGSFRVAYDGLQTGQLTTVRQRETTASRASELTSLEWRQRGLGRMAVRYVQRRASDAASDAIDETSSRVELDLPALVPTCAGCPDLRAAVTAGSNSLTGAGLNSKLSGRVNLIDDAALSGETELGIAGGDGQLLRAIRVMTEMPVVPTARLQLSYSYRAGRQFPIGQVFEARILRRLSLGW